MRRTTIVHTSGSTRRPDRTDLRVVHNGDGALVVHGDLDAASAHVLDRAMEQREAAAPDRPLTIDLGGVGFMDSSGLRTLVAASIRAGRRGTRVALRSVKPELARLLEITGLRDQFGVTTPTSLRPWRSSDHHVPRNEALGQRSG